jgi:uncharacterized protein YjbJ (UPF0337 family)
LLFAGEAVSRRALELAAAQSVVSSLDKPEGETAMNWDRVEGNWKQFKGQVQQKWGKLTSDDLDMIEGKRTELAGRLQERYGVAKDEAEREIDNWLKASH